VNNGQAGAGALKFIVAVKALEEGEESVAKKLHAFLFRAARREKISLPMDRAGRPKRIGNAGKTAQSVHLCS